MRELKQEEEVSSSPSPTTPTPTSTRKPAPDTKEWTKTIEFLELKKRIKAIDTGIELEPKSNDDSSKTPIIPVVDKDKDKDWSLAELLSGTKSKSTSTPAPPDSVSPKRPTPTQKIQTSRNKVTLKKVKKSKTVSARPIYKSVSTESSSSSISWAEDAHEQNQTLKLGELWADIDKVCFEGGSKPIGMSNSVYNECLEWRKAFPDHHTGRGRTVTTQTLPSPSKPKAKEKPKTPVEIPSGKSDTNEEEWSLATLLSSSASAKECKPSLNTKDKSKKLFGMYK